MSPDDFEFISEILKERSGLVLTTNKMYLLESRLLPVARNQGIDSIDDLVAEIRRKKDPALIVKVTEAMTTNESFFFRDNHPFETFTNEVLPKILEKRASQKSFKIWCAAASSGQEPYSLAMSILEQERKLSGWRYDIVGTDISHDILAKAKAGTYSQFEVQRGMPTTLLVKYFEKNAEQWELKPEVRKLVNFKYFNLLENPGPLGRFDIVFCRNVLIYFDQQTKGKVLDGISKIMSDDGVLFLGGAETVLGVSDAFKAIPGQRGVYGLTRNG